MKRKFKLVVERDKETGRWSAVFPELPGCASAGDSKLEAVANAREALELWFEPFRGEDAESAVAPHGPSSKPRSGHVK